MPKIEIEWYKHKNSLNEIYQVIGTQFAFVTSRAQGFKQCCSFCKCRDYLHDIVRTSIKGGKMRIYGMTYETDRDPAIDLKRMRMLVKPTPPKGVTREAYIKSSVKLLRHFERSCGVKGQTSAVKVAGKKEVWMLTSPALWMRSPFLISMYTFLIRLGSRNLQFRGVKNLQKKLQEVNKTPISEKDNDSKYLADSWNRMHILFKNLSVLFGNKVEDNGEFDPVFDQEHSIHTFHNNGGIKSLCSFSTFDKKLNEKFKKLCKKEGAA